MISCPDPATITVSIRRRDEHARHAYDVVEAPRCSMGSRSTDKGSLNQRAMLTRRAALVDEL